MMNCRRAGAVIEGQEDGTESRVAGAGMADGAERGQWMNWFQV